MIFVIAEILARPVEDLRELKCCLALVRVDRATAAISAGAPILLGEQPVQLAPAAFANFDWST